MSAKSRLDRDLIEARHVEFERVRAVLQTRFVGIAPIMDELLDKVRARNVKDVVAKVSA